VTEAGPHALAVQRHGLGGSVAVVTGASGGIGRAIVHGLAASGVDVVGVGRRQDMLESLGEEIARGGDASFKAVVGDLTDPDAGERLAAEAWAWRGRVDILVNAAGVIMRSSVEEATASEWDETFAVNVRGTFLLTQRIGSRMLAGDGGSVVNITSLAGEVVTGAPVTYAASKAAMIQVTRYLAAEWAPKVRVNAVAPGYVRTDLNAAWLSQEANMAYVVDHTPMSRVATPDDVVGAVLFLASPAAAYITGHNLKVDGGWSVE
jgi:2-deoxy-D-gluconate 3-dehydrogenase